ncbi:MAG: hypothetical protein ABI471_06995 [Sphingomonas bacterium]
MESHFQDAPDYGFSIPRVFTRAFATIAGNPGAALGIAFLFGALPMMGYHYLENAWPEVTSVTITPGQPTPMPPHFWPHLLYALGILVLNSVIGTVVQGAFAPLVLAQDARRRLSSGEVAVFGFSALVPLILLGLVIGVVVIAASLFLLIPGIIISLIWAVAAPALVIEHCGIRAALARSRMLTAGARVRILVIMLVIGGVAIGCDLLADRLAGNYYGSADGLFGSGVSIGYLVTKLVGDTAVTLFIAAMIGALYVELRNWKDSTPTDALIEIFA